ncbi:MAG: autotransporter-associated beta strand repeat-containing protein [Verrucomicrobiota bacterium]
MISHAAGQTTINVTADPAATIDANQVSGSPVTVNVSVATTSSSGDGLTKTDGGDLTVNFTGTGAINAADIGINLSSGIGDFTITSGSSADPVITSGSDGLLIAGLSGDFSNAASIASSSDDAIRFSSSVGGSITNTGNLTTGSSFGDHGISILGSVGNGFTNSGQIGTSGQRSGGSGIYIVAGTISGDFVNDIGGDIFSKAQGIALFSAYANNNFTNHANIDAQSLDAILLSNTDVDGSFTNTGDLMASLDGININGGTVGEGFTNSGQIGTASQRVGQTGISITGNVSGDFLNDTVNDTGGDIYSSDQGILLSSNLFGDFTNNAFINSRDDIAIEIKKTTWGAFLNTGTVQGDTLGVKLGGLGETFTNSGSITGSKDDGIEITVTGIRTFENQAGGTITGSSRSVEIIGAGTNFTNAGTLNGDVVLGAASSGGDAGNVQNTVTLDSSGVINGMLDVGIHTDTTVTLTGADDALLSTEVTGGIYSGSNTNTLDGSLIKDGTGTWTIDQDLTVGQGTTIQSGTLQVGNGGTTGSITGDVVNEGTLAFNRSDNSTFSGNISGTGSVNKTGSGDLTFSGTNSYSGDTVVSAGRLVINNADALGSGNILIDGGALDTGGQTLDNAVSFGAAGGSIQGTGIINADLALNDTSQVLAPGNSPGIQSLGVDQTWSAFTYEWETNDWLGTVAGDDYDQIQIDGELTLTGTTTGSYLLDILSLTAADTSGDVPNFLEQDQSWLILTTTTGITGFDAAFWDLDTSGFTSDPSSQGAFTLSQEGNNLKLDYTAVPEPSTILLLGLAGSCLLLRRRIRFRH